MAVKVTRQEISLEDLAKEIKTIVRQSVKMPIEDIYPALLPRGIEVSYIEFTETVNCLVNKGEAVICAGVEILLGALGQKIFCHLVIIK